MQREKSSSSIISLSDCSYIDIMLKETSDFDVPYAIRSSRAVYPSTTQVSSLLNDECSAENGNPEEEDYSYGFSNFDILCGRSKLSHRHKGNKRFRIIIEMNRERYQNASNRADKTRITSDIIDLIRGASGRFLKWDTTGRCWNEASEDYTREKVSHALRSAKPALPRDYKRKKRDNSNKLDEFSVENNEISRKLFEQQQEIMMRLISESEEEEAVNS